MTAIESVIAYGIRFDTANPVIRFEWDSVTEDLALDIDVDTDYFMSGDGGRYDLLFLLQEALNSHSTSAGGPQTNSVVYWHVYLNDDGLVQIDVAPLTLGVGNIYWGHANSTLDPNIFGFGRTTYTAIGTTTIGYKKPQGLWYPGRAVTTDTRSKPRIVGGASISMSGLVRTTSMVDSTKYRQLYWTNLTKEVVLEEYRTDLYSTFEYAWSNSISKGYAFKYFEDSTKLTHNLGRAYSITSISDPIQRSSSYNVLWDVNLSCVEQTAIAETSSIKVLNLDENVSSRMYTSAAVVTTSMSQWTVAFWFNAYNTGSAKYMVNQWETSKAAFTVHRTASDEVTFNVPSSPGGTGGRTVTSAASTVVADTWIHVTAVFDGAVPAIYLYIDGILDHTGTSGTAPSSVAGTSILAIGGLGGASADPECRFDDVCVYNRALEPEEAVLLAGGDRPDTLTGLIRWWGFEGTLKDSILADELNPGSTVSTTYGIIDRA